MGFLGSLFKAKHADALEDAAKYEEELEELEQFELGQLQSERSLINQVMFSYDAKSKLVQSLNIGTKAFGGFLNGLRKLKGGFSLMTSRLASAPKTAWVGMRAAFGGDVSLLAELALMRANHQKIQQALQLAVAQENPALITAQRKLEVINKQQKLLKAYADVVVAEKKAALKEIVDISRQVDDLKKSQQDMLNTISQLETDVRFGAAGARRAA